MKRKLALILPLLVGIGLAVTWVVSNTLHVSWIHSVEASYFALPPDDDDLINWMRTQPGIIPHTVHVRRTGNGLFEATFMQSRNLLGRPSFPDLEAACDRFGYKGTDVEFRDVPEDRR